MADLECGHRLAFIRSERRDVYETGHFRIVPGFSDYCSTVGVANENRRAVLCCQSPLGIRYVVFQRYRRILDDGDPVVSAPWMLATSEELATCFHTPSILTKVSVAMMVCARCSPLISRS